MGKVITNNRFHQNSQQVLPKRTVYNRIFYEQQGPKHLQSLIIQIAKKIKAKEVLDVGAGSGWLVKTFRENGLKAYGIDSSPLAIKKGFVEKAQATDLPFLANRFDLITAVSLIEHLNSSQAKKFLKEARRVLKPEGYLFLITPNFASPVRLIQRKRWHGFCDPTHVNFYTPLSLKKLLEKNGFDNIKFTFPAPKAENFDWTVPEIIKKLPKPIKFCINFLATSTYLSLLKNSFYVLSKSTKFNKWQKLK